MSERKVLNKYYPPDFDPSKIPRVRQAKNRQFTVRLMAPFNMKCTTCGEYIYKGKKFNARKEDVENETYLGIRIYRFYIKCTRCLSEISFKTDPQSTDYVVEAGATRNFMAFKLAEEQAIREMEAEKEEERTNPMKLLENRTKASRGEIETVEALEELKELNKRKVIVNFDSMLGRYDDDQIIEIDQQEAEDEKLIKSVFGEKTLDGQIVKRLADDSATDILAGPSTFQQPLRKKINYLVKPKSTPPPPPTVTKPAASLGGLSLLEAIENVVSDSTNGCRGAEYLERCPRSKCGAGDVSLTSADSSSDANLIETGHSIGQYQPYSYLFHYRRQRILTTTPFRVVTSNCQYPIECSFRCLVMKCCTGSFSSTVKVNKQPLGNNQPVAKKQTIFQETVLHFGKRTSNYRIARKHRSDHKSIRLVQFH
uniref:Splicing factor YJU2 n=1 Tax=Eubosmina coregoni TaxID=186181 RepID=A0A4Y7LS07_9CRUS|nr:EOG090X0G3U [Eubosmina coregoni]SVE70129.1 EOG090X0G3U [Eubosmina coregoni]